jgi:hypothetical protein
MVTRTLAPVNATYAADDDFGVELRPPRLQFSGKNGTFKLADEDDETATRSVQLVPLRVLTATRMKWSDDEDSNEVLCRSADGLLPVSQEEAQLIGAGPTCTTCQFGQFVDDGEGGRIKPSCTQFYNMLMATYDNEPEPVLFSVKSTSIKVARTLMETIARRKQREKVRQFSFVVEWARGEKQSRGKQEWYPLTGKILTDRIEGDMLEAYAELMRETLGIPLDVSPVAAELAGRLADSEPVFDEHGEIVAATPTLPKPAQARQSPPDAAAAGGWQERPATKPQIEAIARGAQAMDAGTLEEFVRGRYGCLPAELTRRQASELIDALKARAGA